MRNGREVVDEEPARYALVSSANRTRKPDRFSEEEMALIRSICEQEILGHPGVTVLSFDVTPTEIRLTCDTSPELPSEKVIRDMWPEYYAGRRCRRNLDDPEVMLRVRKQARSIASLMGMMALRITQALNRIDGAEGSVWSGRFRSILLASALYMESEVAPLIQELATTDRLSPETIARLDWELAQLLRAHEGHDDKLAEATEIAREAGAILTDREAQLSERTEDVARLSARHQSAASLGLTRCQKAAISPEVARPRRVRASRQAQSRKACRSGGGPRWASGMTRSVKS